MKPLDQNVSSCRHCHSYQGEGRRGGHCQQLGVPVQGAWKACSLACPAFAVASISSLDELTSMPGIVPWQRTQSVDPVLKEEELRPTIVPAAIATST